MRWKSSEDEKPAWNRAKVPIGAAGRALPSQRSIPEINKNLVNPWKSLKNYKTHWNTVKVFRGQETSLEASKRLYRSSKSTPTVPKDPFPKSMKVLGNLRKSIKVYKTRWKSSENKTPAWNRAHGSIAAAGRSRPSWAPVTRNLWKSLKIDKNHQILWTLWKSIKSRRKFMQIRENLQKSI